uniref:acetyltransferase n=1 Tax=Thaumasiovibrio occultus TaxID=1891184 RepID=UPI000B357979|nr:acetyltransferase [Thaumasiovibrio occultus]
MHYDIFNGDADGIIALLQLRLAQPKKSRLVTGVKRDIKLLSKVNPVAEDSYTVLDISMEKNIAELSVALEKGVNVTYVDHHRSGPLPSSDLLTAHIDLDANTCTSLIVDALLGGRFHAWAITAAYGDNLIAAADQLATKAGFTAKQAEFLKELGTLINYNGYGTDVSDLHYSPDELYLKLYTYSSPFALLEDPVSPYFVLKTAYEADIQKAETSPSIYSSALLNVIELADEAWARRVSGVFGNALANSAPSKAHAVFTKNRDGVTYTVSLRAPLTNKQGAGEICSRFPTGGGREAAAGVNSLHQTDVDSFIYHVEAYYSSANE